MQIKLKNAPKNYKHLEKFVFEVIGEKQVGFLPVCCDIESNIYYSCKNCGKEGCVESYKKMKYSGTVGIFEETHYRIHKAALEPLPVTKLKIVSVSAFSLPFKTDCRNTMQVEEGHAPIHLSENPTKYSKNDACLLGMELSLDLNLFTVLPA